MSWPYASLGWIGALALTRERAIQSQIEAREVEHRRIDSVLVGWDRYMRSNGPLRQMTANWKARCLEVERLKAEIVRLRSSAESGGISTPCDRVQLPAESKVNGML